MEKRKEYLPHRDKGLSLGQEETDVGYRQMTDCKEKEGSPVLGQLGSF